MLAPAHRSKATADNSVVVLHDALSAHQIRAELLAGLMQPNATIAPKFFYDPQGCALFSAICELEEYYPTRTEAAIFDVERQAISAHLPRGATWVDLGCGDGLKSQGWISAAQVARYIGVDIAHDWLQSTLATIAGHFREVETQGVVADFNRELDLHAVLAARPASPAIFFYPGSSIGNFSRPDALHFLRTIRAHLNDHGRLLIGIDLIKDSATLEAAYDDALGVTAAFNRNILRVANRWLDGDFEPANFIHRAHYDSTQQRIEMRLHARHSHDVHLDGTLRRFEKEESILTEHSHKYSREGFAELLTQAGFGTQHFWSDAQQRFGVFVAAP